MNFYIGAKFMHFTFYIITLLFLHTALDINGEIKRAVARVANLILDKQDEQIVDNNNGFRGNWLKMDVKNMDV